MKAKCPRCERETDITGNPFRPFCSERCKLIDLGNWISGSYRIPEDTVNENDDTTPEPQEDLSNK